MTIPSGPSAAPRPAPSAEALRATRHVAAQRWRIAILLTVGMIVVYFGFILLVAFAPTTLGTLVTSGVSVGIVLGACVIVAAWLLTYVYVRWANTVYDPALASLRTQHQRREQPAGRR